MSRCNIAPQTCIVSLGRGLICLHQTIMHMRNLKTFRVAKNTATIIQANKTAIIVVQITRSSIDPGQNESIERQRISVTAQRLLTSLPLFQLVGGSPPFGFLGKRGLRFGLGVSAGSSPSVDLLPPFLFFDGSSPLRVCNTSNSLM